MTHQEIKKILETIVDPSAKATLLETGGVYNVSVNPEGIVEAKLFVKDLEKAERIVKIKAIKIIKQDLGFPGAKVEVLEFEREKPPYQYLGIASGKGGVGKSSVTKNLALALNKLGIKTGIVDSDIYGASIPFLMKIKKDVVMGDENEMMIPLQKDGVEVMSTEFFMPDDTPLMWRGPVLYKMLTYFFNGVRWHENTKLVLIDLPPGTGDIALDVNKFAPEAKMIIVTTPDLDAAKIAVKAGLGAAQIGHEILGVVENMSYYQNYANNKKDYIFGKGGAEEVAKKLDVEILGKIPIFYNAKQAVIEENYLKIARRIKELLKL